MKMKMDNVDALAEQLFRAYGAIADLKALKHAEKLRGRGDESNSLKWLRVTDRVREMQNLRHIRRSA
jgi:hypothetical protein